MTSILAFLALTGAAFASDSVAPGSTSERVDSFEVEAFSHQLNRCDSPRCRPQARPSSRNDSGKRSTSSNRPTTSSRPATRTRPATSQRSSTVTRSSSGTRSVSRPSSSSRPVRQTRSSYRPDTASNQSYSTTSVSAGFSIQTTQARPHGGIIRPLAIPKHRTYSDRAHNYDRPSPRRTETSTHRPSQGNQHHRTHVTSSHRTTYTRPQVSHTVYQYRPYHGVFVYGPRVQHHSNYRGHSEPVTVRQEHLPDRSVNRQGTWAFGVRSGSYLAAYDGSNPYGDFGLGVTARYRPFAALGIEAAITHHDQTWENVTERSQPIGQASVMVFANPWGRISPYALGGLSANARMINDQFRVEDGMNHVEKSDVLWGPHAGVGIELAFGKNVALDLEARYTGYLNTERDDPTIPGALQTTAGFLVHF